MQQAQLHSSLRRDLSERMNVTMIKGFKMKLYSGMAEEYERRHNLLWPEMKEMIHEHGGRNYSIFLDEETMATLDRNLQSEEEFLNAVDGALQKITYAKNTKLTTMS